MDVEFYSKVEFYIQPHFKAIAFERLNWASLFSSLTMGI